MRLPGLGLRRAAFAAYAVPLFVATHWPALTVPLEGRWDLLIHAAVFAGWNLLLTLAAFFGPPLSGPNILASAVVASLYAGADEGLQAVPFLHRTAAWDDFAANVLGVWAAAGLLRVGFGAAERGKVPAT